MASLTRWSPSSEEGPRRLRDELDEHGGAWLRWPEGVALAESDPAELAMRMFGRRPVRMQVNPIRPVAGDTSGAYALNQVGAVLHTDCPYFGLPPHVQVMACVRPAERGGATQLADMWSVLPRIEAEDPTLFAELFDRPRLTYFGPEVSHYRPTFSLQRGSLVCIQPAEPLPFDEVGHRLRPWIEKMDRVEFTTQAGDLYVNDNLRSLHGRSEFSDPERHFVRLLYWFADPLHIAPAAYVERARASAAKISAKLIGQPEWVGEYFGVSTAAHEVAGSRRFVEALSAFAELPNLSGIDPSRVDELVYCQEVLLNKGLSALSQVPPDPDERRAVLWRALGLLQNE